MWNYNNQPFETVPEGAYGIVYRIGRSSDGKAYIGRKAFETYRKAPKRKGARTRPTIVKESKWRDYRSSCLELQEEINRLGDGAFSFDVLAVCYSKAQLTYQETRHLFLNDVLFARLPDGSPAFWNQNIGGKWFPSKVA